MDWTNRNVAVLFGDGAAAVVLQATDRPEGVLGEKLGCYADARQTLRVRGTGLAYANGGVTYGDTHVGFRRPGDLQARGGRHEPRLGRRAGQLRAHGSTTSTSSCRTRRTCGSSSSSRKRSARRWTRCSSPSSATATCRPPPCRSRWSTRSRRAASQPGSLILTPAFGGGLTWCSHLIRWGERTTPLDDDRHRPAAADEVGARDGARRSWRTRASRGARPRGSTPSAFPSRRSTPPGGRGRPRTRGRMPGSPRYEVTSLRCACTLIRMPSPTNSDTSAVPP